MASPFFAADLLTHLAALVAVPIAPLVAGDCIVTDGATRNAWSGRERSDEETPARALFAQEFAGMIDRNNDGPIRKPGVQLLFRSPRSATGAFDDGLAWAKRVHDALDGYGQRNGQFTVSGHIYMDIRAVSSGPDHLEVASSDYEYFAESFNVWFDG
jgi:hypothetical protein